MEGMDLQSEGPYTNGRGLLGIPAEILSTILEMSKSMTDELLKDSRMVSEITLSHICILLRNVALTSPRLWATIQIRPLSSPHRIMEYVRRSGACPLDLRIETPDRNSFAIEKDMELMLDLVVKQSFRWRSLSAECIRECTGCPTITRIGESSARALQYLSLNIGDVEHIDAGVASRETGLPHIFEDGAPKLKFVRLRGLAIQVSRPPLDVVAILHLEQTRYVPLAYSTFRNIITRSSSLAHLSVHGDIIGNASWLGYTHAIHLPNLISLRICGEGGDIYSGLLLGIEAPLLESLTLKDVQEHDLDPLLNAASPSQYNKLRQLVFTNFDLSNSTYRRIFNTFRDITSFSAVRSSISESPLINTMAQETMRGRDSFSMPWPNLAVLTFSLGDDEADEEEIQKLNELRSAHQLLLPKIRLRIDLDEMPAATEGNNSDAVEYFFQDDPWPPNCDHLDYDDDLFYC